MPSKTSGAARIRRKKRGKMWERYRELNHETPVIRIRTMYEEFGPFWSRLMMSDTILTQGEILSERYQTWWNTQPKS